MRISNATGYAIAALTRLATHKGDAPLSCHRLCEEMGMPERFVLQILRSLGKAGLVTSSRGVQGGFRLARPLNQISVIDVCDAVEGPAPAGVPTIGGLTANSQSLLDKTFDEIVASMRRKLGEFTLDRLQLSRQQAV